ncbi:tRNA lysidine(34) synthetase TilS [Bartonella doshiae]|uniref:tRNA(Ile)-lysidine synthase n=2 Tax=Bartonella doshiae TaxID=33044 RepID=A0A380ZKS7_BARDO|nr:tRNA lysidine(34) synthetase TilS [Bartonella doshiae]EJF80031.1 tRNA(Ile)-lysidine synthase [Bartonella doshiae NCTC 12862 = ATCC 700133]MBB6158886.1 tRNA(Ile)-lysidine synthase [Bartonella doshiae]SUV45626.1 tRNA(Ile)-lysidine synthase [Bartonella doshiae]
MLVRLAGNLFKTSDFIQCQKLILAVSGGGDSLALLFLVQDHLKTLSFPPEMIVVTVDHQLRPESAREAENVAEICRAHHIKHIIVRWKGKKPKTHIAEKARIARYDLLFEEAQKQNATLIMTGHTLNDQIETYQMRYQRLQKDMDVFLQDSSLVTMREEIFRKDEGAESAKKNTGLLYARGLSCIPREALLHRSVRLIRPLLGVKRETLRAYLRLKGKTWIEDPTNEDLNFERVRVRQSLHPQQFITFVKKVHEAALKRREQAQKIADLILALDIIVEHGRCFIAKPAPFLHQHPSFPFVVGLFAVLMGGSSYLLPYKKLIMLDKKLCLHSSQKQRFTLAGSVIEYNSDGISFWRESRNIKEISLDPGKTCLWDGRYQITNHEPDAIKIGAANLEQLKYLCKNSKLDCDRPHFPSLQSLLMISNGKAFSIPELTSQAASLQNITMKRVMAPFNWLLSYEDAVFINVLEPFFNIEVKR